jgi:hypothetical protein
MVTYPNSKPYACAVHAGSFGFEHSWWKAPDILKMLLQSKAKGYLILSVPVALRMLRGKVQSDIR